MNGANKKRLLFVYMATLNLYLGMEPVMGGPRADDPVQLQNSVGVGDITRSVASAVSGVQLSAGSSSDAASVKLANPLTRETSWSLIAATPISDKGSSGENSLASLDGLANGFSLKVGLTKFHITNESSGSTDDDALVRDAEILCEEKADISKEACQKLAPGVLVRQYPPKKGAYQKYLSDHFPHASAIEYGMQLGTGFKTFSYFDGTTLAPTDADHVSYSAKAFIGLMPNVVAPQLFSAGFEFQHAYKSVTSQTLCKASTASIFPCVTGAIGPPNESDKYLFSLEYHRQFDIGIPIAIAPMVTYDANNKETGVDLPLYVISDTKGNLIAGLDLGWTSKKHAFTINFVVGAPFSLFN